MTVTVLLFVFLYALIIESVTQRSRSSVKPFYVPPVDGGD
jgi:hypothetical protein